MHRLRQWCEDINQVQTETDFGFVFVDETKFNNHQPRTFGDLFAAFREYRTPLAEGASSSIS